MGFIASGQIAVSLDADEQRQFEERTNLLLERMARLDPAIGGEWLESLKATSEEDVKGLDVFLFLVKQDSLFPKEQFLKSRSDQLLTRMKMVPKNDIGQWHSALSTTSGDELTRAQTVILMIQVDRLFSEERFSPKESTALLSRLKTVSGDAISKWQKDNVGERVQAAIAICISEARGKEEEPEVEKKWWQFWK